MAEVAGPEYGSDLVVDLLTNSGVVAVAFNPGATVRGLHDSIVHAGPGAIAPVLCTHEAISVAIAHGYAKASGRPMAVLLHNIVGLQNASMAIYNAWCDRVPMLLLGGTGPLSKASRRPWIDWIHTSHDQADLIRDFTKWDDQPHDVDSIAESFRRAFALTTAVPPAPVYLCYDVDVQEQPLGQQVAATELAPGPIPTPPTPTSSDVRWLAEQLAAAHRPLIIAGRSGQNPDGFRSLIAVAELLGCAVVDTGERLNLPSNHPLNVTGDDVLVREADVLVGVDVDDLAGFLSDVGWGGEGSGRLVANATPAHLHARGWSHDYQRLPDAERHLTGDGAVVLQELERALGSIMGERSNEHSRPWSDRVRAVAADLRAAAAAEAAAAEASDHVPLARVVWEVGRALDGRRFVVSKGTLQRLEHRLWDLDQPNQHLGGSAGGGLGYGVGATIGAALATGPDVVAVSLQPDGDMLYLPSALWTLGRLDQPALVVAVNNRRYGNSVAHAAAVAEQRGRDTSTRFVGTALDDPPVDIAGMARSFGLWATGPISDVDAFRSVLSEANTVLDACRPAVIDVLTASPRQR